MAGGIGGKRPHKAVEAFAAKAERGKKLADGGGLHLFITRPGESSGESSTPSGRMAHRLCAFTAARIGNVIEAGWREFHLDDEHPAWTNLRAKMRVPERDIDHRVPLCP